MCNLFIVKFSLLFLLHHFRTGHDNKSNSAFTFMSTILFRFCFPFGYDFFYIYNENVEKILKTKRQIAANETTSNEKNLEMGWTAKWNIIWKQLLELNYGVYLYSFHQLKTIKCSPSEALVKLLQDDFNVASFPNGFPYLNSDSEWHRFIRCESKVSRILRQNHGEYCYIQWVAFNYSSYPYRRMALFFALCEM